MRYMHNENEATIILRLIRVGLHETKLVFIDKGECNVNPTLISTTIIL